MLRFLYNIGSLPDPPTKRFRKVVEMDDATESRSPDEDILASARSGAKHPRKWRRNGSSESRRRVGCEKARNHAFHSFTLRLNDEEVGESIAMTQNLDLLKMITNLKIQERL